MVRLIPRTDPEANVLAYQAMENPLKKVLQSYANRNIRDTMKKVTGLLKDHGYDGTNRNTVMIKQASPSTIRSLEELGQRLPDGRRQAFQSKLYGQIGSGSLTVRKAVNNLLNYGTMQDVDRLYKDGKDILRETAKEGIYRGEFMVQKSVGVGWTMETPGIKQVDAFLKDHWSMRDATSYMRPMSDALKDQVEEALFMGESPQKMAKRIEMVEDISDVRAKRNARTITTAVANEAQMGQYKKDGIKKYRWVATFDERTCPECGHLDGQEFDLGKQAYPPLHPNCRCTTEAVLDKDADSQINKILEAHKNDPRARYVPKSMNYDEWKRTQTKATEKTEQKKPVEKTKEKVEVKPQLSKYKAISEEQHQKNIEKHNKELQEFERTRYRIEVENGLKNGSISKKQYDELQKIFETEKDPDIWSLYIEETLDRRQQIDIIQAVEVESDKWKKLHIGYEMSKQLEGYDVEYKGLSLNKTPLTHEEICQKIGGKDKTEGSCVSQALTYIGNTAGYDVTDFRGGDSQDYFASEGWKKYILCTGNQTRYVEIEEVEEKYLNKMEKGETYFFCTGEHSSLVRQGEKGPEYLELQAEPELCGWKPFKTRVRTVEDTLIDRFGSTGPSLSGMCNIKDIVQREDLIETLGYINTESDKALRGAGGSIK